VQICFCKAGLGSSILVGSILMCETPTSPWARPERVFAIIALVFGHALVLTIPPFQSADEPFHLLRAYEITEGVLIHRQVDARGIAAGYLPASLYQIWLPFSHIGFHPERRASVRDIRDAMRVTLNPGERIFITFPNTAYYSPVCYLPQCLGIILGRVLGVPALGMLYLGREFNLLFWTFLGYWAVRSAPVIARPLVLILLMPMSLYVASTLSADAPTNAFAAAYTAMICNLISRKDKTVNLQRFLLLAVLSLAVCLCKFAYAPLLGLMFLIPASRFGGRLRYAVQLIVLVGVCAAILAWMANSSSLDTQIRMSDNVSARRQFHLLEQSPLNFAQILLETFRQRGWLFIQSYVGLIGWLDKYLPAAFVVGYLAVLFSTCMASDGLPQMSPAGRDVAVVLPSVSISCLIIALLDYLYWTPVGSSFIEGIHGRYLIPLSPAVALLMVSAMRRLGIGFRAKPQYLNLMTAIISLVSCGYFLDLVWNRYYG
jgi:uncharacterized membrane protein